jgi:hypothetical protein
MATILKEEFANNVSKGIPFPFIYVDSINQDSYVAEMYNATIKFIRENIDYDGISNINKSDYMAKDYNDIYYNKKDGFWIVSDEDNNIIELYKKETNVGKIYNNYNVNKIYKLTCHKCPRIVPKVFKKTSKYDSIANKY